jgi:predicted N-formylglutamate amidohydrolase
VKRVRRIILSCEHAGNRVPPGYKHLFTANPDILTTHRAYDIGIAAIARQLQKMLDCPLCFYKWTRLLIDVNRTRKQSLFSQFSEKLNDADKPHLLDAYDKPYKDRLNQTVSEQLQSGPVLHLSLHSFTPVLQGQKRNADIGILYDPSRSQESTYAKALQSRLRGATGLRIRRNYPYRGRADGAATWLRKHYAQTYYLGIELELNQAFLGSLTPKQRSDFVRMLAEAI